MQALRATAPHPQRARNASAVSAGAAAPAHARTPLLEGQNVVTPAAPQPTPRTRARTRTRTRTRTRARARARARTRPVNRTGFIGDLVIREAPAWASRLLRANRPPRTRPVAASRWARVAGGD